MFTKNSFIEPRSGTGFTVEVKTDSIVANFAIIDGKGVLVDVEFSRANLCTLLHMLELTLLETPNTVAARAMNETREETDAASGS